MVGSSFYNELVEGTKAISVVGLGYVGLPIAHRFSEAGFKVIGFDINEEKISQYLSGYDSTNEIGNEAILKSKIRFTSNLNDLSTASFHIVSVPTPIYENKLPDYRPLVSVSTMLGKLVKKGDYVIFESTVYPGLTRNLCKGILEKESGLKCPEDFKIGYSPERINPGDKINTIEKIVKVVSGIDEESLELIAKVYREIIDAGIHKAESIEVAEASKIIENAQRDINIAFMNELSKIFNKLDISTQSVLEAAKTKWNFLDFQPGLVGGHCISVDPYYLIFRANELNIDAPLLTNSRKINDGIDEYIVSEIIKKIVNSKIDLRNLKMGVLGITFKENTPDFRNSKSIEIVRKLESFGIVPMIVDPLVDKKALKTEENLDVNELSEMNELDILLLTVGHQSFLEVPDQDIKNMMKGDSSIIFDLKGKFPGLKSSFEYWSL